MTARTARNCSIAFLIAALPAISPPTATAELINLHIPGDLLTNCNYTISADLTTPPSHPAAVTFYDNATPIPGLTEYHPDTRTATITWTPTSKGEHIIAAIQLEPDNLASGRAFPIQVTGDGLNLGSSCARIS